MTAAETNLIDLDYIAETAACLYEDGEGEKANALIAMMSDEEKADFTEYVDDIHRKWARAAASRASGSTLTARNAAGRADDFEGAILDRQDRRDGDYL